MKISIKVESQTEIDLDDDKDVRETILEKIKEGEEVVETSDDNLMSDFAAVHDALKELLEEDLNMIELDEPIIEITQVKEET